MRPVILESPYGSDDPLIVGRNVTYARRAMRDALLRGDAPFASHLLYTQEGVLNDRNPYERRLGINAGFVWRRFAVMTVVYTDYGISEGMKMGMDASEKMGVPIEVRKIGRNDDGV